MTIDERYDVVVIGAGFTGIAAASELAPHKRVLVLEAAPEIGGRCRSVRTRHSPSRVDVGAHYFGAAHLRVRELVRALGLEREVVDYVASFGPDPIAVCDFEDKRVVTRVSETYFNIQGIDARASWAEQARFLTGALVLSLLCDCVDGRAPHRSLFARRLDARTYADFIGWLELPRWFADLMRAGAEGVWSQSADRMSLLYFLWYLKNNGGFSQIFNDQAGGPQQYGLRCGMQGLLEAWAATCPARIEVGQPVTAVRVREDGVDVQTRDGRTIRASDVLVTVTPRVAGEITFEPELSAERRLLHAQAAGYAIKAVMFYDEPWWHASAETGGQMYAYLSRPGCDQIDWILACSPPEGDYFALTVFVMPELIDRHAPQGDAAVRRAIADAVVELVRDPRAREYAHMELCDWRAEPFVRGGPNTTFERGVLTETASVFNRPEFGRLYFASSEYATVFTGYVDGAIAAGRHAARQILEHAAVRAPGRGVAWLPLLAKAVALPICLGLVQGLRVVDALRGVSTRAGDAAARSATP